MRPPLGEVIRFGQQLQVGKQTDRRALGNRPDREVAPRADEPRQQVVQRPVQGAHLQNVGQVLAGNGEVAACPGAIDLPGNLAAELLILLALLGPEHLLDGRTERLHAAHH